MFFIMAFSRWLPLVLFLCCCTSCNLRARPPLVIHVTNPGATAPYRMNGHFYTTDRLKQELAATVKEFPKEFSEPPLRGGWGSGLIVMPDENASFSAVLQLLQLLKECDVAAYSIMSNYKQDPKALTLLTLPVHSTQLRVEHEPIAQAPPVDKDSPQDRIQEITEKMGGLPRK